MFKKFAAAALALTLGAAPASAGQQDIKGHQALYSELRRAGISVFINPEACWHERAMGWYAGSRREIVICQENKEYVGTENTNWSDEDLDTLRHEAHHFVQDCALGANHDGYLDPVYKEPVVLAENTLSADRIQRIIRSYRADGASDHVVILELEAFSVAAINDPWEQVQDIRTFCF